MRILSNTESLKNTQDKKAKSFKSESNQAVENKEPSFLDILEAIVPSSKEETKEINSLWQKLPDIEKRFLKEPNQYNLTEYKNLIKDITNSILKNNMQMVQARRRGRADKKVLMSVKIIDENIQILAMTMLNPNNSAFSLLKQIEKIRGLLMDLKE
ncbi:MAG: DUF327 family protein [Leptospiraceae bacterium]|nr:DUF327 family protein [Leptospiraceae bacterium]